MYLNIGLRGREWGGGGGVVLQVGRKPGTWPPGSLLKPKFVYNTVLMYCIHINYPPSPTGKTLGVKNC